jgi:hypothetical protein
VLSAYESLRGRAPQPPVPTAVIPELPAAQCAPPAFLSALRDAGVIILRQAVSTKRVVSIRKDAARAITYYTRLAENGLANVSFGHWWGHDDVGFNLSQSTAGYISDAMLQDASETGASFYDLIADPRLHGLIAGAFPGTVFGPSGATHCRRVSADGKERNGWAPPIQLHCDRRYHQDGMFALNFWTPLEPAGAAFNSPSLEVIPISFSALHAYLEPDTTKPDLFTDEKFSPDAVYSALGRKPIPVDLVPGDIMVFTSWTLHRTYIPSNAERSRLSAEVRLVTNEIPPAMMIDQKL